MKTGIASFRALEGYAVTRHLLVRRLLLLCGIAAPLTWMATDVIASLCYQGYNYPFDVISSLSAIGAPTRSFVSALSSIYIVLKAAFSLGVWISAGQKRALRITAALLLASALTDLVWSFFPWDPAQDLGTFVNMMHGLFAGITVLVIFLTIGFGATANGKWFRLYSYGTLLLMIILGALPILGGFELTMDQPPEWFGASERINAYGYMLWMIVLAIIQSRSPQKNLRVRHQERQRSESEHSVLEGEPSNARDDHQS
jgi:heme A synthase